MLTRFSTATMLRAWMAIKGENGISKHRLAELAGLSDKSAQRILTHYHSGGQIYISNWIREKSGFQWIPCFSVGNKKDRKRPSSMRPSKALFDAACAAMLNNHPRYGFWGI